MDQTAKLLDTLKFYLKSREITYLKLAQRLKLSESSIKRLFSEKTLSLKRLERILHILDLDFYELVRMSRRKNPDADQPLTVEQEKALSGNSRMLVFFYLLTQQWMVEKITDEFHIETVEATEFLLELDRLRLIDLHPHNRVRTLVSRTQLWNRDSPFMKINKESLQNEFLSHPFKGTDERFIFSLAQLSEDSVRILLREIDRLLRRFKETADSDADPSNDGKMENGLMIAFRPWVCSVLENLRRKQTIS